ncbi:hypothetical protein AQJ23_40890 [Streptomyces antibioticus]|nr:hypothetical protein AQJ23_40890 [Streptomyces antibioticus]
MPWRSQRGRLLSRCSTAARQGSSTGQAAQIASAVDVYRWVNHRSASCPRQAAFASQAREPASARASAEGARRLIGPVP